MTTTTLSPEQLWDQRVLVNHSHFPFLAVHTIVDTKLWRKSSALTLFLKTSSWSFQENKIRTFWSHNNIRENKLYPFFAEHKSSKIRLTFCYLGFCHHAVKRAGEHSDLGIFHWCDVSFCLLFKNHAVKHGRGRHSTTLKTQSGRLACKQKQQHTNKGIIIDG